MLKNKGNTLLKGDKYKELAYDKKAKKFDVLSTEQDRGGTSTKAPTAPTVSKATKDAVNQAFALSISEQAKSMDFAKILCS